MSKYTILFFSEVPEMGGAEHSIFLLLTHLDKSQYTPILICNREGEFPSRLKEKGVPVKYVYFSKLFNKNPLQLLVNLIGIVCSLSKIMKLCNSFRPALIHSNTSRMHILTSLAGRLFRVPVLCHVRWIPVDNTFEISIVKFILKLTKPYVIAISKTVVEAYGLQNNNQMRIIYNGFIIPRINQEKVRETIKVWQIPNDSQILLALGRLEEWKGQDYVIRAFHAYLKQTGKKNIFLFIVGDNLVVPENKYKEYLHALTKELHLSKRIIFTGHVLNPHDYIAASRLVFHSSITPEPFGRVVVEAMMLGKPVIASNIGGPTEVITHGKNGYLCNFKNIESIVTSINHILSDDAHYNEVSKNALTYAQEHFHIDKHISHVTRFYNDILCAKNGAIIL